MRKDSRILKEALAIHELSVSLENISHDDGKAVHEYTRAELISEAHYVLSCYFEGGHVSNEELSGDHGEEALEIARKEVNKLKLFIRKWRT